MGEITSCRDLVKSAVLYTRLANMGLGVLRDHADALTNNIKTSLRRDVASACLGIWRAEPIRIMLIFWASASRFTGSLNKKSACKNSTGSSWSFSKETSRAWS